jgi:hypothetical protein
MEGISEMTRLLKAAIILSVTAFSISAANAEDGIGFAGKTRQNPLKPSAEGLKGLFSIEKFDMQQTVGLSFGTGANRFSQYYLNTMVYKVSEPLTIQVTLGLQNQKLGSNAFGATGAGGVKVVIPNIGILYQPTPNLKIEFGFSNTPYHNSGYDSFWGYR